jgi:glutamate-1-semialdehyde 2,1-aminomutase
MADTALTNSRIVTAYREKTRGSAELAKDANGLFPSGITHDSRYIEPYGIYATRAPTSTPYYHKHRSEN